MGYITPANRDSVPRTRRYIQAGEGSLSRIDAYCHHRRGQVEGVRNTRNVDSHWSSAQILSRQGRGAVAKSEMISSYFATDTKARLDCLRALPGCPYPLRIRSQALSYVMIIRTNSSVSIARGYQPAERLLRICTNNLFLVSDTNHNKSCAHFKLCSSPWRLCVHRGCCLNDSRKTIISLWICEPAFCIES